MTRSQKIASTISSALFCLLLLSAAVAHAQQFQVIHTFMGHGDGGGPYTGLTPYHGKFLGTSYSNVFSLQSRMAAGYSRRYLTSLKAHIPTGYGRLGRWWWDLMALFMARLMKEGCPVVVGTMTDVAWCIGWRRLPASAVPFSASGRRLCSILLPAVRTAGIL